METPVEYNYIIICRHHLYDITSAHAASLVIAVSIHSSLRLSFTIKINLRNYAFYCFIESYFSIFDVRFMEMEFTLFL